MNGETGNSKTLDFQRSYHVSSRLLRDWLYLFIVYRVRLLCTPRVDELADENCAL